MLTCYFYNPSVSLARATSLYTREAYHRPTVHSKGVTHYTLRGKECEKEYEQNCPYSFCCRAGVYLPPFSLHISFVFGGSKPPPYKVAVGKTCFMESTLSGLFYLVFCVASTQELDASANLFNTGGRQRFALHDHGNAHLDGSCADRLNGSIALAQCLALTAHVTVL